MLPRQNTSLLKLSSGGNALSFQNGHMVREAIYARETNVPGYQPWQQLVESQAASIEGGITRREFERQLTSACSRRRYRGLCIAARFGFVVVLVTQVGCAKPRRGLCACR